MFLVCFELERPHLFPLTPIIENSLGVGIFLFQIETHNAICVKVALFSKQVARGRSTQRRYRLSVLGHAFLQSIVLNGWTLGNHYKVSSFKVNLRAAIIASEWAVGGPALYDQRIKDNITQQNHHS